MSINRSVAVKAKKTPSTGGRGGGRGGRGGSSGRGGGSGASKAAATSTYADFSTGVRWVKSHQVLVSVLVVDFSDDS